MKEKIKHFFLDTERQGSSEISQVYTSLTIERQLLPQLK